MNTPYPIDRPAGASGAGRPGPLELVHLRHPRDLAAVVPYLLGYHASPGSLVAVCMRRSRVALTTRVDASALVPDDMPGLWARLARALAQAGTEQVALVGYLPETGQDLLQAFAAACPAPVLDVQRVHDGRWWSLTCPNGPDCCPPGQPITADPALIAPLIAAAGGPAASRDDVAACLQPGPVEQTSAVARLLPLRPAPTPAALYRAVADAHAASSDGPVRFPADQAALLLHAVTDLRVRDAACVWYDDAAFWLWTALVGSAPDSHRPPVATLIATTAYQRGDTMLARMAAEHALALDPDYGLGQLVLGAVAAYLPPAAVREALAYAFTEIAELPDYRVLGLPRPQDTHLGDGLLGTADGGDHDG